MFNAIKNVAKACGDKVMAMDTMQLGKCAAGTLMLIGGIVIIATSTVKLEDLTDAVDVASEATPDPADTAEAVVEAANVMVETVTE